MYSLIINLLFFIISQFFKFLFSSFCSLLDFYHLLSYCVFINLIISLILILIINYLTLILIINLIY